MVDRKNDLKLGTALGHVVLALGLVLAGCSGGGGGGGGGSSVAPPPPPPPPSGPDYTPGVYEPASTFKDQCETPRTGLDLEDNPFPDKQGSLIEELFWLRSWTEETYLWNDEVEDQNPYDFEEEPEPTLDFFEILRTFETTASGKDKDDFHFSQPTEEFLKQRNSEPVSGYGARIVAFSSSPPRDYRILYTEPNSPASSEIDGRAAWERGMRILSVDGVDLVNGGDNQGDLDILNAGLFPADPGKETDFGVRYSDGVERSVTITSADVAPSPVNQLEVLDVDGEKVGYVFFNTFSPFQSEEDLFDAFTTLSDEGVSDVIIDLRYNGGGLLAVAAQLGYMVAGEQSVQGQAFEKLRFNNGTTGIDPVTGQPNQPIPFIDEGVGFTVNEGTPLPTVGLDRVFILSTGSTCSASEAVINALRGIDVEVILIGDTTCGKPFGFFPTDNCGTTFYTIQFQGVNDKDFGDFADGFIPANSNEQFGVEVPGCQVEDDLDFLLGETDEPLLAAALRYREDGTCPTPPSSEIVSVRTSDVTGGLATATIDDFPRNIFETNMDMRMPEDFDAETLARLRGEGSQ
jgi:carboxyl-terminal processing protease